MSPGWGRLSTLAMLSFLQYYEMSYGLNIEMHKQVTIRGTGVCGKGQNTSVGQRLSLNISGGLRGLPKARGRDLNLVTKNILSI